MEEKKDSYRLLSIRVEKGEAVPMYTRFFPKIVDINDMFNVYEELLGDYKAYVGGVVKIMAYGFDEKARASASSTGIDCIVNPKHVNEVITAK